MVLCVGDWKLMVRWYDVLNDVDSNHFSSECCNHNRCTNTRSTIFRVFPVHVVLNSSIP